MRVLPIINNLNFRSVLPAKVEKATDGWDELERLCCVSDEKKNLLYEQLHQLNSNGNSDILALEHYPLSNINSIESFSFRLYKDLESLNADREKEWMVPQRHINKELKVEFFGNHSYKISYGFLDFVKRFDNIPKEKTNILLATLKNVLTKGTREYSAIFGKTSYGNLPKEIVSKFRMKG